MEIKVERYTHWVYASGGSTGAELDFHADGSAAVHYRYACMIAGKREFRMRFQVVPFSERYGLLCLTEVERLDNQRKLTAAEINEAVVGFHEDEERMQYWGVAYEFLRLAGGEEHVPNDPHLMDFKPLFNSAGWNDRMDLILFARFPESAFQECAIDPEIAGALCALDRLKLERKPDKQSAPETPPSSARPS